MPHITNSYIKQTKIDAFDHDTDSVSSIIPNVIETYIKIPIEKPKITSTSIQSTFRIRERNSSSKKTESRTS
mgnify:CR=1 FL=1